MRFAFKILPAVGLLGVCLSARADLVDAIQAIVGESLITYQQIQSKLIQQDDLLIAQSKNIRDEYYKNRAKLENEFLTSAVNEKMILHEFASAGFKIPESIIEDYVQDNIKEIFHDDRVAMTKQLEHEGISYEDFKQQLHDDFIVRVMRQKFVPEPIISPLKVETYYQNHKDEFKVTEEIKMRFIVLNKDPYDTNGVVRRRMEEIISQVKDGAAFSDLAKSYSEGSQRPDGGETGWQETSKTNPVLVEAIDKLKPGEYSGVIEDKNAYFFVLLEERRPARVRPLAEVRADVEKTLLVQEKKFLFNRWIDRLKRKTFIEFL